MAEDGYKFSYSSTVTFEEENHASTVHTAMSVDAELRPDDVKRELSLDGTRMTLAFASNDARMLRAAVGTFYDLLALAVRTLEAFKPTAVV
jgi:EKC/KEOPS complex subunit PCC1/LAGE3